jgi:hypothetical protein
MREWFIKYWAVCLFLVFLVFLGYIPYSGYTTGKQAQMLKDYKDGIQNHLTWSIKGECFFVRPNDEVTVYLVRVPDCDKK